VDIAQTKPSKSNVDEPQTKNKLLINSKKRDFWNDLSNILMENWREYIWWG